ncbi:MAG: class I SAM-dependent RNA methyltransferase [Hyphomicrobiales bacterium]
MVELVIASLGAQGDGQAIVDGGTVYVPFTLPGERVEARVEGDRGQLVQVLGPGPDRVSPACRHFGECGGCALQHMGTAAYLEWKRGQVVRAFAARGLSPEVAPAMPAAPGTRRRAVLTGRRQDSGVALGYHRRHGSELADVAECPVLRPAIVAVLPALRNLLGLLLSGKGEARVTVLETATGLDILIAGVPEPRDHRTRAAVAAQASGAGIARLTVGGELLSQLHAPRLYFGETAAVPPPGAFVQAVAEAEAALVARVLAACKGARQVADLFCGAGTFTLPLARGAQVTAVEMDKDLLDALEAASASGKGLRRIRTERRDLFREPLSLRELSRFDAVVFDPPRAGAKAQAQMLARSRVPVVVAVSCNPATLARDARILVDGGYRLGPVEPVDQFLWSPHVEAVAVFTKG